MNFKINFCLFAACLLAGCASEWTSKFTPIQDGFGYVTHVKGIVDQSLSTALCYRDNNGKIAVVWPSLDIINGDNPVIKNDTAILVGGKAELYYDGVERLTQRLIVFKGPSGPPMDVTDQILEKYYAGTGLGLTNFMKDGFASLTKTNNLIQIEFVSTKGMPGGKDFYSTSFGCHLIISWHDIEAIMADVKKNGKLKKEKWSGTEYLQKD
jgi:hypothetical protein